MLGIYIGEAESASFWLGVLTDLQLRGVKDLLICSIDNLAGFGDAIETIFPQAAVQLCLVYQMRASMRYVVSKEQQEVAADLKPVYKAASLSGAEQKLADFEAKWGKKNPLVVDSWPVRRCGRNWLRLSRFFEYPAQIRKAIYTTNPVEGFHRQVRSVTKSEGAFSSEMGLVKLLYLVIERITQKWTMSQQNWALTLQQLTLLFGERVTNHTPK